MSQITSGTGLFSGIDTGSLIEQLLAVEGRPRALAQQRIVQLQTQQAAYLDINSKLNALRTAATKFGTAKLFRAATATSTNTDVLTGTAASGATLGTYAFVVDRLVSTEQQLSRGFSDRGNSAVGAKAFTFESAEGRLDRDSSLAQLNGGDGIVRGKVRISDASGASQIIDLSRVATINDVLEAINTASGISVSATVDGSGLVIEDTSSGSGFLTIEEVAGATTAASLGIRKTASIAGAGGAITGDSINSIGAGTSLSVLNDGNGIRFNRGAGASSTDFLIQLRDGSAAIAIDIGDVYASDSTKTASAVSTFQQLKERIESQTAGKVTVAVSSDGAGIRLVDNSGGSSVNFAVTDLSGAAEDLGIVGSVAASSINGSRILGALNSTLVSNLRGGAGLSSGAISITARDGSVHNFTLTTNGSVSDLLDDISTATGGDVTAALDETGTGLVLTDSTGGTGAFIVAGAAADELGLATAPAGVAESTVSSDRLQHRYISESTLLSSLNAGRGLGTGKFAIVDSNGRRAVVSIDADTLTIGDLITEINSRGLALTASINDHGDGVLISENPGANGSGRISVTDTEGDIARSLRLAGESSGTGTDNVIDGSFETLIEFEESDTLDDVATKINDASAGVRATVIYDGSGGTPFRLSLSAVATGEAGRFTLDTGGLDLGLRTISHGRNARAFFGASDPAAGVLVTSTTNTLTNVVAGVSVDLRSASDEPVNLTVAQDADGIVTAAKDFITAFNDVLSRVDAQTVFDQETNKRGPLLGDSTAQLLRQSLLTTALAKATGVTGQFTSLTQIGVKVTTGGKLSLDEGALRDALADNPDAVAEVFAAKTQVDRTRIEIAPGITVNNTGPDEFTSLGVAEKIATLIKGYTDSVDGILAQRGKTLDSQIGFQTTRVGELQTRLESRRAVLQAQFLAMERAIGQLQGQQSSLNGIRAIG